MSVGLLSRARRRRLIQPIIEDNFGGPYDTGLYNQVDTESKISVAGGLLSFSGGKAAPGHGDPARIVRIPINRRAGLTLEAKVRQTATNVAGSYLLLSNATPYNDANAQREHSLQFRGTMYISTSRLTVSSDLPFAYSANTWYWLRIVLKATGALCYVSPDRARWYLLWEDVAGTTTPMYLVLMSFNAACDVARPLVWQGQAKPPIYSQAVGAITPTLLDNLVSNGDMETGDPPTGWTPYSGATLSSVADERTGGSGSKSINAAYNGTNDPGITHAAIADAALPAGTWIKRVCYAKKIGGGLAALDWRYGDNSVFTQTNTSSLVWVALLNSTTRMAKAGVRFNATYVTGGAGAEARFDDIGIIPYSLPSMLSAEGIDARTKNLMADITPTIVAGDIVGIMACLDSASNPLNYLHALMTTTSAVLIKVVNGVTTDLASGAITYSAGAVFRLVPLDGKAGIYYNGVLVGTVQTADTSPMGTLVKAWANEATASCGTLTVRTGIGV